MANRAWAVSLVALGVISGVLQVVSFFGVTGVPLLQFFASNLLGLVIAVTCLSVGLLTFTAGSYQRRLANLSSRLQKAQQNVMSLLGVLYADARFTLVRFEYELRSLDLAGNCRFRSTYVLTARQPEDRMTCYVEIAKGDDANRAFREVTESCSGGTVSDNFRYFNDGTNDQERTIVEFSIKFDSSVHLAEHTISFSWTSQKYLISRCFKTDAHMALPTDRSVILFKFEYPVTFSNFKTVHYDDYESTRTPLDSALFTLTAPRELKWEIARPKFQTFYMLSFDYHPATQPPEGDGRSE